MTSKFTSRNVRTHHLNKGDFDFGGVSVKGVCGKVRRTPLSQGDIWINGFFTEDDFVSRNFTSNAAFLQTSQDCNINDLSEVDWISKEIAYQDIICDEKASYWPESSPGRTDLAKEDNDVDIISTLTAVAALLQDWCVLESELSPAVVKEPFESPINFYSAHDEWLWTNGSIDQSKVEEDVSLQGDVSNGIFCNAAWDGLIQEPFESQQVMCHKFLQAKFATKEDDHINSLMSDFADGLDSSFRLEMEVDIDQFSGEKAEQGFQVFEHFRLPKDLNIIEHSSLEAKSQNLCAYRHTSKKHLIASRYSFGRDDDFLWRPNDEDVSSLGCASSDVLENHLRSWEGLSLGETNECGNVVNIEPGKILFPILNKEQNIVHTNHEGLCQKIAAIDKYNTQNEIVVNENVVEVVYEVMPFVVPYMCLQGLLNMEKVCKPIRDWIRNDTFLWQKLCVEPPLSKSLTDDALLELASRSKGQLRCLDLVDCTKVTEAAVEQVVLSNPRLTKLSLPGCLRISADAIVRMVELLVEQAHPGLSGLKQLRIRNIYGLTKDHLAKLENMVGGGSSYQKGPQYYHNGHHASFCDDERPIDVEECPKCTNVRLVYDCTREKCRQNQGSKQEDCRACFLCTVRCEECGRCINDDAYEETFSLDLLCSCCWLRLPKCATCSRPSGERHIDLFTRTPQSTVFCGDCSAASADFMI